MALIPLDEVQAAILGAVARARRRSRSTCRDALGLVLAEQVVAPEPVPPFAEHRDGRLRGARRRHRRRSRRRAGAAARRRRARGRSRARPSRSGDGEAIRIMTGAPMPDGADAIVMVERTERDGEPTATEGVLVTLAVDAGPARAPRRRRPRSGRRRVRTRHRAHRAAHRRARDRRAPAACARDPRARVGVLSTGDELVEIGAARAGQDPRLQPADAARAARRRGRRTARPR